MSDGSLLKTIPVWGTAETDATNEFIWGDYDNDGDLDLFAANGGDVLSLYTNAGVFESNPQPNRLSRNDSDGESVTFTLVWSFAEEDDSTSAAWGDYDLDGDLDVFVGNYNGSNRLFGSRLVIRRSTAHTGYRTGRSEWRQPARHCGCHCRRKCCL